MRGQVLFFLIVAIMLFGFIVIGTGNGASRTKYMAKDIQFTTFTSAVCEDRGEAVYCKDELFSNCKGKVSKAQGIAECAGFKINASEVSGFAVFGKDWKDKRG